MYFFWPQWICTLIKTKSYGYQTYAETKTEGEAKLHAKTYWNHTFVWVAPWRQMRLCRVWVKHINILVKEKLHKLCGLQKLPLAAHDAGSLLRCVQHTAAWQRENHHEGILRQDTERRTNAHVERCSHRRAKSQTHTNAVKTHTLVHLLRGLRHI